MIVLIDIWMFRIRNSHLYLKNVFDRTDFSDLNIFKSKGQHSYSWISIMEPVCQYFFGHEIRHVSSFLSKIYLCFKNIIGTHHHIGYWLYLYKVAQFFSLVWVLHVNIKNRNIRSPYYNNYMKTLSIIQINITFEL